MGRRRDKFQYQIAVVRSPLLRDISAAATSALPADAHTPDVLRVGVAAVAAVDDGRFALDRTAVAATARRLITAPVLSLPLRRSGPSTGPVAAMLWPRLSERTPEPADLRALDSALVLLADHELAASTVAVRVAASTRRSVFVRAQRVGRHVGLSPRRCVGTGAPPVRERRSARADPPGAPGSVALRRAAAGLRSSGVPGGRSRGWRRCGKP